MLKKNDKSQRKKKINQAITKSKKKINQAITKPEIKNSSYSLDLITYLNRIITTQTRLIETNFTLKSFMNFAVSQVQTLTKAAGVAIELIQDDKTIYHTTSGSMRKYNGMQFNLNDSVSSLSINTHQIIYFNDLKHDERINKKVFHLIGSPAAVVTAPLFHDGKAIGTIKIFSKKIDGFNDIAVQTLRIMAGLIGYAISQQLSQEQIHKLIKEQTELSDNLKKAEKKIKHTVHHDYLTGLPNRNLFNEQLNISITKAKRNKQLVALMYLDIDHFKKINETVGHAMGDKVLFSFAMRLKQCVRASDVIARLGGDEFILLIDDIKETQDVIVIVDKILQAMRKPFNFNKKVINLTTSIGVTFLSDPEISADDFIKQADQALYISKNSGRNTFYVFNNELLQEMINVDKM